MNRVVELAGLLLATDVAKHGLPIGANEMVHELRKQKARDALSLAEAFITEADKYAGRI